MATRELIANWVQRAPAFFTDSAMRGLTCGAALSFAQRAGLHNFLPRLIMTASPVTFALAVAGATLARHTVWFIAAAKTEGQTETTISHPEGGYSSPRHTLGPINGNRLQAAKEMKNQLAKRAMLIAEIALISLAFGNGISIAAMVSTYFAIAFAANMSELFFIAKFHRDASQAVQESSVQTAANDFAKSLVGKQDQPADHPWGPGQRLGQGSTQDDLMRR